MLVEDILCVLNMDMFFLKLENFVHLYTGKF